VKWVYDRHTLQPYALVAATPTLGRIEEGLEILRQETPSGESLHIYDDVELGIAQNHTFSLLTVGYFGPGYTTDLYDCPVDAQLGDSVTLSKPHRTQLNERTIPYYPAFRVAHIQHAPGSYSVSLNLVTYHSVQWADQFFFDVS